MICQLINWCLRSKPSCACCVSRLRRERSLLDTRFVGNRSCRERISWVARFVAVHISQAHTAEKNSRRSIAHRVQTVQDHTVQKHSERVHAVQLQAAQKYIAQAHTVEKHSRRTIPLPTSLYYVPRRYRSSLQHRCSAGSGCAVSYTHLTLPTNREV